jgi:hypothetical protein
MVRGKFTAKTHRLNTQYTQYFAIPAAPHQASNEETGKLSFALTKHAIIINHDCFINRCEKHGGFLADTIRRPHRNTATPQRRNTACSRDNRPFA